MNHVLWAKSRPDNSKTDPPTVARHCRDVREAAEALWDCVETDLARALKADVVELRQTIRPLLLVAALLHDVGKANSSFQALVQRQSDKRQPVRHEVFSALLLVSKQFWRDALGTCLGERDLWAVAFAIAGHHLQTGFDNGVPRPLLHRENVPGTLTLYLGNRQVRDLLTDLAGLFPRRFAVPYGLGDITLNVLKGDHFLMTLEDLQDDAETAWKQYGQKAAFRRDVAVLKAMLIAADVAGSALRAAGEDVGLWIKRELAKRLTPDDLGPVIDKSTGGRRPRDFQSRVAESDAVVTLVTAGCGNGKTTAAYLWAQRRAIGRKLLFTYPTTGTASAGFKDYLSVQSHLDRTLIHSRAWVDLQTMPESPDDEPTELAQRLESLQAWGQDVIACTVDTVLGLVQNQRRPLFAFPAIVTGAVVFDEVHSYDRRLFGSLLRFLEIFPGLPVLLMSATLPPARFEALRRVAGDRMSVDENGLAAPVCGDKDAEDRKRYCIARRLSATDCWPDVERARVENKKVLWVCNTVGDAVEVFGEAKRRLPGVTILLYHSRFLYDHRVKRQDEVVNEFAFENEKGGARQRPGPAIVVGTQVCEMSLDLSADLLVSALCPLPSLVQRLGRLNRYARVDDDWPCMVYDVKIGSRPYNGDEAAEQMHDAAAALAELDGIPCGQTTLATYIARSRAGGQWTSDSAWLDGGWHSEPRPLRDSDNSITVVRAEDMDKVETELGPKHEGRWNPKTLVPWTVPLPLPNWFRPQRREGGYAVAPHGTVTYDDAEGAKWV